MDDPDDGNTHEGPEEPPSQIDPSPTQTDDVSDNMSAVGVVANDNLVVGDAAEKETQFTSKRQGPRRRQGICRHHESYCDLCTHYCKLCLYRSSKVAVRKHMQRVHPGKTFSCQICDMKFGIPYDMRRHRMLHFTNAGELTDDARALLVESGKQAELNSTLYDYEENFVPVKQEEDVTEEILVKQEDYTIMEEKCDNPNDQNMDISSEPMKCVSSPLVDTSRNLASQPALPSRKTKVATVQNPPREHSVYKCLVCEKILKSRGTLQLHYKEHDTNTIYQCDQCTYTTSKHRLLNSHICSKHLSVEARTCEICQKVFSHGTSLQFHKESVHGIGGKTRECPVCQKTFTTKRFLQVHIKRVHHKVKAFRCQYCEKDFFEKTRMIDHQKTHLSTEQKALLKHFCSQCGKGYAQKAMLKQHENIHNDLRPYKCQQCTKGFAFSADLTKHKKVHSTERPHICLHCGKGFKFPYKLAAHLVTHTKEGQHFCAVCEKVYTSRSSLRKHNCRLEPLSTSAQPQNHFRCTNCEQVFSSIGLLHRHDCTAVQTNQLLIFNEESMEQPVIVQTLKEEPGRGEEELSIIAVSELDSTASQSTEPLELTCDVITDIIPAVIHNVDSVEDQSTETTQLPSDHIAGIVQAVEGPDDSQIELEQIKDLIPSNVLYMCCVCNSLYPDQALVNAHMESEHGAEAVIAHDTEVSNVSHLDISQVAENDETHSVTSDIAATTEILIMDFTESAGLVSGNSTVITVDDVTVVEDDLDTASDHNIVDATLVNVDAHINSA